MLDISPGEIFTYGENKNFLFLLLLLFILQVVLQVSVRITAVEGELRPYKVISLDSNYVS